MGCGDMTVVVYRHLFLDWGKQIRNAAIKRDKLHVAIIHSGLHINQIQLNLNHSVLVHQDRVSVFCH